jgi:hypothetical protein
MRETQQGKRRFARVLAALLAVASAAAASGAPAVEEWVPARWDGGPVEAARRAQDKELSDPAVREAISRWYDPATLGLLDGTPVNCLLVTLSAGAGEAIEKEQRQLVGEYARLARERGVAVLGLVYPGADPAVAASAAAGARLDGVVLEGAFPDASAFAGQVESALRAAKSAAVVIAVEPSGRARKSRWAVAALEGVAPNVGKASGDVTASATGGLWVDSNMWLVRSFRPAPGGRPVWIAQRPGAGPPEAYLKSVADAAAAGGRWVVALDGALRAKLYRREAGALAAWKRIGAFLSFFEEHAKWRGLAPFGAVGIVLDPAGPNLAHTEEYLNLVARRQIPYRVIERSRLDAAALEGMRAVLAFDLAPATESERKTLFEFAEEGGLVLGGPSWGTPPKEQSYTIEAAGEGEVAVYKEAEPDPEAVARDLNDLLSAEDLGVSVSNAPSVLSYVTLSENGGVLIQLVNYADAPAESVVISIADKFSTARLYAPASEPVELPVRRSGRRTEIAVPNLAICGAVLVE